MKLLPLAIVLGLAFTLTACPKKKAPDGEGEVVEGSSTPAKEGSSETGSDEMQVDKKKTEEPAAPAEGAAAPAPEEKK